ncbi:capsid assembly protein [Rhodobacter lacus]|uniref:Capsid assembly protein n=1 Tax=Rhodobacter lacus TaxID=1641972 RepID=A0ABW5ADU9_9RHOB
MPKFLFPMLLAEAILRAPDDGAGSFFAPDDGGAGDAGAGNDSEAGGDTGAGGADGDGGEGRAPERPEWLLDKYATPEDQAKAYRDLYGRFSKKTDDLRKEVLDEAVANYGKTIGVPDDAGGYEYPEGFVAPAENIDTALRSWAKQNNVSPDAFKSLVQDVHGLTLTNLEAERGKLGEHANDRISEVSRWVKANVDKSHFGAVAKVMTSAEGVEMIEAMMKLTGEKGFVPKDGGANAAAGLTRSEIRALQADPRFGTDEAYTAMVRAKWTAFSKLPADRQK